MSSKTETPQFSDYSNTQEAQTVSCRTRQRRIQNRVVKNIPGRQKRGQRNEKKQLQKCIDPYDIWKLTKPIFSGLPEKDDIEMICRKEKFDFTNKSKDTKSWIDYLGEVVTNTNRDSDSVYQLSLPKKRATNLEEDEKTDRLQCLLSALVELEPEGNCNSFKDCNKRFVPNVQSVGNSGYNNFPLQEKIKFELMSVGMYQVKQKEKEKKRNNEQDIDNLFKGINDIQT